MKLIINMDDNIEARVALTGVAKVIEMGKISTQAGEPCYCFLTVFNAPTVAGGKLSVSARSVKGQKSTRFDVTVA